MSLPIVFRSAGILPTSAALIYICICSGLCGTMMSQTIASIPGSFYDSESAYFVYFIDFTFCATGNRNFALNVDFSSAFRLLLGGHWYAIAETIFVSSCMVQACSAIVQVAQCLDSMIGSFLWQTTFAIQLYPSLDIVFWSGSECKNASPDMNALEECTPFFHNGPIVLTLGYLLVVLFFLPMSMHHLKETIWFQVAAVWAMFVLVLIFDWQFIMTSMSSSNSLNWIGSDFSRLGGVALFNYAYSVTVPAWLSEKKSDVSVNKTIWGSAILSTVIYITFGIMSTMAFVNPGENILVLLGSSEVLVY